MTIVRACVARELRLCQSRCVRVCLHIMIRLGRKEGFWAHNEGLPVAPVAVVAVAAI